MKKLLQILCLSLSFFGAPSEPQYTPPEYLITQIHISCSEGFPKDRYFSGQEQMGAILEYLRSAEFVDDEGRAAVTEDGPTYSIALLHATGRVTVYRQMGDRFLVKGSGRWREMEPEQGQMLGRLYHGLPEDPAQPSI